MGNITMNKKEREQSKVFEQVEQGMISRVEASRRLRITTRWLRKKIKRYYDWFERRVKHCNKTLKKRFNMFCT